MLIVAGFARVAPSDREAMMALVDAIVTETRKEHGCLDYSFAADLKDPTVVRVFERWSDQAALDAHFQTPHVAAFNAGLAKITVEEASITVYDASVHRKMM